MILCLKIQKHDFVRNETSDKAETDHLLWAYCTSKAIKPV